MPWLRGKVESMKTIALQICLVLLATLGVHAQELTLFDTLSGLDGNSYKGHMTFPDDPTHSMNKPMLISIRKVSENQLRIPLHVGEDKSRIWILTRTSEGILLKHDHRHKDGTPDDLTNYGGLDTSPGLGNQLTFPADAETAAILPAASTNVWSLRLSPDGKILTYYLERGRMPRFEAQFDLSEK